MGALFGKSFCAKFHNPSNQPARGQSFRSAGSSMPKTDKVPEPAVERLAIYCRPLEVLLQEGTQTVSSDRLAARCGVHPAQVRKDLAYFGEFGIRGVGYDVRRLLEQIRSILGTDRHWSLAIIGMGNLGKALVESRNFRKRGYRFVAAFDTDPVKVGTRLPCGLVIQHTTRIEELVKRLGVEIGVITTPAGEAQRAADLLLDSGVKAVLNFAPVQVRTPDCCVVENVDFTVNLENLVYHLAEED